MDIQSKTQILAQLFAINNKLIRLYGTAYAKAINLSGVMKIIEAGEDDFDWDKHPDVKKQVEKIMADLSKNVAALISNQTGDAHRTAEKDASKAIVKSVGGYDGKELSRGAQQVMNEVTDEHRGRTAETAKKRGIEISNRVWNYNDASKQEIQIIIQNGIKQGMSAADMTAGLKKYLQNPDALFRRVRNKETGELELSEAAKNYHPGPGVYRSAYKNALRLARTEVNMAYRQAEWQTYQDNPLVKAYEIRLSNNHTTTNEKGNTVSLFDVCDKLAGIYPKQFKWTGWHPQCRCMMLPVTLSPGEFREYSKAKKEGKLEQWKAKQPVVGMPKNFTDWIAQNAGRIKDAQMNGKSIPYFLKDNYQDGDIDKGLAFEILSDAQRILMLAKARHEERSKEQIDDIKARWEEHQRIQEEVKKIQDENSKPYYQGRFADEIDNCTNMSELDAFMVKNGIAKSTNFGKVTLEDAKQICKVLAEMQYRFTLRAIDVSTGGTSRSNWYMRANGSHVEINSGYWRVDKISDTLRKGFYDSVINYVNSRNKTIQNFKNSISRFEQELQTATANGDKAWITYYSKQIKKLNAEIKKIQDKLDAGVNRFNQFLSRETMLRDCFAHEMGHVVHDQVTGGINGPALRRQRFDSAEASKMNTELDDLYKKYKKGDRFVTEYGMSARNEFLAESMVLYMYNPNKLAPDVLDWFNRLELMAHGGKLPEGKISWNEAYKIYQTQNTKENRIKRAAEERHKARTAEREQEIREFWEKKKEEGDIRRHREEILAKAEARHAARTQEERQEIIDKRSAELAQFAVWEKAIRDTEARAKLNDWLTDEEKVIWVDGPGGTQNHLDKYYISAKRLSDRMDVIDAMRPEWNNAALHTSVFGAYRDKLDEARRMITNGFKQRATDILNLMKEIKTIEPRYVDMRTYQKSHPGKGGKKSKIEIALDEAEDMIKNGDIKGAEAKIAEAEKTRKINEASALAKAEAARKKKEEAERKKAEEEARKKQSVKDFSKAQSAKELFDMLGDDRPTILENYEKSVARSQWTDRKYVADAANIERKLKEFFDGCDYAHRVPHWLLEEQVQFGSKKGDGIYLRDGIPTNLQVNSEGKKVLNDPNWSLKGSRYDEGRRSYGHFAYGYQNDQSKVPVSKRLKDNDYYRCGTPVKKDDVKEAWGKGGATGYGDTQIILRKDRVVATFTYGNSLGNDTIPSLVCDPKVCSIDKMAFKNYKDAKYNDMAQIMGSPYNYIELQYLPTKQKGQISPSDWKSVTFEHNPKSLISDGALNKLYDYGVDVYYVDQKGDVVLFRKGKPQITHEEAKTKLEGSKKELEDLFNNESTFSNMDVSIKGIQEKMKNGDYIGALEDFERYKEIEVRKKNIIGLIPDVDKWHKQFTIDELESAHKAIKDKIDYMDNIFKAKNAPEDVLKKWVEEIDKAENPDKYKAGAKRHRTWTIAKEAYQRRRNELVYEYHKDNIENDLRVLRGFNTKDKGFTSKMKELEAKVNAKDWSEVEIIIKDAQNIMKGLGERVLRLGDSGSIKFSADEFTQAKRNAAKWFKDPDIRKAYKEADDYMSKYAQELWKNLSEEEKHILWLYSDGSKYINDEMLGTYSLKCVSPIDGTIRNGLADANMLTSIIDKAPALKEAMWMQSGKSIEAFNGIFGIDIRGVGDLSKLVGKEGYNSIFSSCHSSSDGYFTKGGSTGTSNQIVMSIYMPKGTKGVYMEPFASYGDNLRWTKGFNWTGSKRREAPSDQVEFLLQRGAKFKITNAYKKNGKWYVDVDLIEQTAVDTLDTNIPGLMNRRERISRKPTLI